jgi:hypothetical protein
MGLEVDLVISETYFTNLIRSYETILDSLLAAAGSKRIALKLGSTCKNSALSRSQRGSKNRRVTPWDSTETPLSVPDLRFSARFAFQHLRVQPS